MPTYDYKCSKCGHTWEKFQSIKDNPIKKCPHCGKNTAQRLIGTGAGLIFKGSGFYITDYRSDSYKEAAKSDVAPKTDAAASTESKSDSKSASDKPAESKPATSETKASTPAESKPTSKSDSPKSEKPKSARSDSRKR